MEHCIENRENERMILSSVQNGPLIWPTVTEEDETKPLFKTAELQWNKLRGGKGKVILVLVIRPKRLRNATWFKDKALLAAAQEAGQILDEEQLAFLTEDLDAYDSNYDNVSNAQAVLMANLSNYGYDVLSEIKPTLYDGSVISDKHVAMHVIDDEDTLILKEVIRSKMSEN
nr:hypothetical protein [Tanacetum cinerariifolium]